MVDIVRNWSEFVRIGQNWSKICPKFVQNLSKIDQKLYFFTLNDAKLTGVPAEGGGRSAGAVLHRLPHLQPLPGPGVLLHTLHISFEYSMNLCVAASYKYCTSVSCPDPVQEGPGELQVLRRGRAGQRGHQGEALFRYVDLSQDLLDFLFLLYCYKTICISFK